MTEKFCAAVDFGGFWIVKTGVSVERSESRTMLLSADSARQPDGQFESPSKTPLALFNVEHDEQRCVIHEIEPDTKDFAGPIVLHAVLADLEVEFVLVPEAAAPATTEASDAEAKAEPGPDKDA